MTASIPPTSPALGSPVTAADSSLHRNILLILVVTTCAALFPLFGADFSLWDDNDTIYQNPRLNPPTLAGVAYFWRSPYMGLYAPLTYTAWAGLAKVARLEERDENGIQLNSWVFHGFNVLLHVAAVVVAYEILVMLVHRPWAACAGAMLFALHPLQVEAVGWVSGMKDVLAGLLMLVALSQYLIFAAVDAQSSGSGKRWRLFVATIAFALALLSKPSAMVLPLIAAWIDWWLFKCPLKRIGIVVIPWMMMSAAIGVVAVLAHPMQGNPYIPLWARPLLAMDSLAFYLFKLIWPAQLCVNYDRRAIEMIDRRIILVTWIVPVIIALALWVWRKNARPYIAAAGVFAIGVLPVLSLVPFEFQDYSITADHYLYVSMFGVAMAAAFLLRQTRGRWAIAIAASVLFVMGVRSFAQARTWRDTETLFDHTLAVNPRSSVAHNNLASMMIDQHRYDDAISHALESIQIEPYNRSAHQNLAVALQLSGRMEEARREYGTAIRLNPSSAQLHAGLASLSASEGKIDEAIVLYEKALRLNPNLVGAQQGLKRVRAIQRQTEGRQSATPRVPATSP